MSASDLVFTVIVVTILVTVAVLGGALIGSRFGRSASPAPDQNPWDGSWYFVRFYPDEVEESESDPRS